MLVRKSRLVEAERKLYQTERELIETRHAIGEHQRRLESIDFQFRTANEQYRLAMATATSENRKLYERLITAEAEGRKASALIAMWTVRVNQLQLERDQLLSRVVPGLQVETPFIGTRVVPDPVESFEHNPEAYDKSSDPNMLVPERSFLDPFAGTVPGAVFSASPESEGQE